MQKKLKLMRNKLNIKYRFSFNNSFFYLTRYHVLDSTFLFPPIKPIISHNHAAIVDLMLYLLSTNTNSVRTL